MNWKTGLACLLAALALAGCGEKPAETAGLPLAELPEDYTAEQAGADGCVVTEDLRTTAGAEVWDKFYEAVQAGTPATVRLANYYDGGASADGRPSHYVSDLTFDGERFTIGGAYGGADDNGPWEQTFSCLLCFPDEPAPPSATYWKSTPYVLTDNETLTWGEIYMGWLSSSSLDHRRAYPVHTEYNWKEGA